jgi:signal peptidase I
MNLQDVRDFVDENRFLDETYFLLLSVVLAFGMLQTLGTGLGTEKPVVTVISTSMCPALHVGDILLIQGEDFESVEEGDTVVYDVPDLVEFSVNGEDYELRANDSTPNPSVSTEVGEVRLLDVRPARDRSRDRLRLSIDGEMPTAGGQGGLVEGESYQVDSSTLNIEYATSLPYEGVPIVHRVVEKEESYLETKGDNNPAQIEFESRVRPDQVKGTMFLRIPRIGLVKILAMDFIGYSGDQPFVFDNTPSCGSA